jgi:Protein of unknown function (DUF3306)
MSDGDTFLARWLRLKQQAAAEATSAGPVDLASLPPIESLTSESDLSVFLQPGVPAELLRAALNDAWRLDPKIRDFVGIAESQWDFNDPNAMPGFGPLGVLDQESPVVRRSAPIAASAEEPPEEVPESLNPQRDGQLDPVWLGGAASRQGVGPGSAGDHEPQAAAAANAAREPGVRRRHGSALPRPS